MSDYETHSGKLRLLEPQNGETLEEQCKRLWIEIGEKEEEYGDKSDLLDEYYEEFIEINESVYQVFDHKESEDQDMFCKLNKNPDGSYSFYTRFYNGGTCLSEMLKDGVEDFIENENQ